ncbi:hypothetical protein HMPREF0262_03477 [Clostridium sp. ATCC 29733]|nr:hypothetical protein HMPREF0262_03477 [Clostridium sp. ATCC 29733]
MQGGGPSPEGPSGRGAGRGETTVWGGGRIAGPAGPQYFGTGKQRPNGGKYDWKR